MEAEQCPFPGSMQVLEVKDRLIIVSAQLEVSGPCIKDPRSLDRQIN
jgi:hypothetical protein